MAISLQKLGLVALRALLWALTVLGAVGMVIAGMQKFANDEYWQYWFTQFGFPAWFSPVIGGVEMVGGVVLLIPRLATHAAVALGGVMLVALYSVTTTPHTDIDAVGPVVNMVILAIIGAARWRDHWNTEIVLPAE